ncbi:hypothetical protein [Streptomyces sp. KR55]|uniref:hypothetical protein n=1 Tax=Streptomyces sp. KR55 TaxID=3457425 RepID=UPI003FD18681
MADSVCVTRAGALRPGSPSAPAAVALVTVGLAGHLVVQFVVRGHNANTTEADILRTARRTPVAVLTTPDGSPPKYAPSWTVHGAEGLRVHVAPAPCGGPAV